MQNWLRTYGFLTGLALFKFVIHFILPNGQYELHRDEYLYLDQANHLAWGFLEVPPLISIMGYITQLLGNSFFWVRFWPALSGALTLFFNGLLIIRLGGGLFAQFLAASCFIFSAYLRLHSLFQPNAADVLLWTLYFYLLVRLIQNPDKQAKYFIWLGILFGMGLLNKYTVAFFILATLGALLFTPQRSFFTNRYFYVAAFIAFVLILPNIWWQFAHDLPFFKHMNELNATQLQNVKTSEFIKDQILMNLGGLLVWTSGFMVLFLAQWAKPFKLIGFIFIVVMGLLIFLHGKSYYTLGLFPILLGFGSVFWEKFTQKGWQIWFRPVISLLPVLILFPILPIVFPMLSPEATAKYALKFKSLGILRWEDGVDHTLPQDYADMLGWQELTQKAALALQNLPQNRRANAIILCDNYGQASSINYFGTKYNLPHAHSENASYLLWMPQPLYFTDVILVGDEPDEIDKKHFKNVKNIGEVTNSFAREKGTKVLLLTGADDWIVAKVNKRIAQERSRFE